MNITKKRIAEELVTHFLIACNKEFGQPLALPVRIDKIAQEFIGLKVDIEQFKDSVHDIDGVLIPSKRWVVLNNTSKNRVRFTLAHEVAHWLIESDDFRSPNGQDFSYFRTRNRKLRESYASYIASSLLIPLFVLFNGGRSLDDIRAENPASVAVLLGVSKPAYIRRIEQISELDKHGLVSLAMENLKDVLPHTFYKFAADNATPSKLSTALIHVNVPNLDYGIYKRIKEIKDWSGTIYAIITSENVDLTHSLLATGLFDCFVFLPYSGLEGHNQIELSWVENSVLYSLSNHKWFSKLETNKSNWDPPEVFLFRSDAQLADLAYSQGELFDLERYLMPLEQINTRTDARRFIAKKRKEGKRVVLVTGCFDILSNGHAIFLEQARKKGDVLVVGVENDKRVRHLKGPLRPVNTSFQRIQLLKALRFVDYAFVINGSTSSPLKEFYGKLHRYLKPDMLAVYGSEKLMDDRREEIETAGGKLVIIPEIINSLSTSTQLLKLIKENKAMKTVIMSDDDLREKLNRINANLFDDIVLVD